MYRFRKIESLIGTHNELENQEIYFALQEELNDPMEGYQNIFWKGDIIVWKNFIKNYIRSVEHLFGLIIVCADKESISDKDIIVSPQPASHKTFSNKPFAQQAIDYAFEIEFIKKLPQALSERSNKIQRSELLSHLDFLHPLILQSVSEIYFRNGILKKTLFSNNLKYRFNNVDHASDALIQGLNKIDSKKDTGINVAENFLWQTNLVSQQLRLLKEYGLSETERQSNLHFLVYKFQEKYLAKLESAIFPNWYSASFLKNSTNSAVWAHYGDNHKGVCLKYKVKDQSGKYQLNLNTEYGYNDGPIVGMQPHTFKKIEYSNKHVEVDFFRSIGRLPKIVLNALWYSDENGDNSICGSHLNDKTDEWRNQYWNNFDNSLSVKLKEWSYEEEYRLLISGDFIDYSDVNKRKLKYDFNDLEGIIFGIKTGSEEKLKIIKIIEGKCRKHKREDFNFYQAYYSTETGKIESHKLNLLTFKQSNP